MALALDIVQLWATFLMLTAPSLVAVLLPLQYLSHCAFHLVHFSGPATLSESLLQSNQYATQWTVHNMSRPHLRRMADDWNMWGNVTLSDWESRTCNVHLLSRPLAESIDAEAFERYAQIVSVRTRDERARARTFFIQIGRASCRERV